MTDFFVLRRRLLFCCSVANYRVLHLYELTVFILDALPEPPLHPTYPPSKSLNVGLSVVTLSICVGYVLHYEHPLQIHWGFWTFLSLQYEAREVKACEYFRKCASPGGAVVCYSCLCYVLFKCIYVQFLSVFSGEESPIIYCPVHFYFEMMQCCRPAFFSNLKITNVLQRVMECFSKFCVCF